MTKKILFVLLTIFILTSCTCKNEKIYDNGVVVSVSRSNEPRFKYIVHVECHRYSNYVGLHKITEGYSLVTNKKYNVGDSIKIN